MGAPKKGAKGRLGAPTKRAKKIRAATEFEIRRLALELMPPKDSPNAYAWELPDIINARTQQMLGRFKLPAQIAKSMRTDSALAVAYENRLAPQRCIPVELVAAKGARGVGVAAEADSLFGQKGVGITPDTCADIEGCLANHGVAFAVCLATPRADGSRIDYAVKYWPIEFVRWDPLDRCFKTLTFEGGEEAIVHGDGRWVVFAKHQVDPFTQEAAILPACLVWARHALAERDWSKGSVAHGMAKLIGEMPIGLALQSSDGVISKEAAAFLELLISLQSSDSPVGIRPAGSKTDFVVNTSTAWQVWSELIANAEKAAARIYLGTDGTLGAQGGAPGVDISVLFGVATTRVQGDLQCIERGLLTGVIEPWAALNFGDSSLAPVRRYMLPDADDEVRKKSTADRRNAFHADIKQSRANGFLVTQEYVDQLAEAYDVTPPLLAPAAGAPVGPAPDVSTTPEAP
jgi:hypothetical protein